MLFYLSTTEANIYATILLCIFGGLVFLCIWTTYVAYKKDKNSLSNNLIMIFCLSITLFLLFHNREGIGMVFFPPISYYLIFWSIFGLSAYFILFFLTNIRTWLKKNNQNINNNKKIIVNEEIEYDTEIKEKIERKKSLAKEFRRKGVHLLMAITLLGPYVLAGWVAKNVANAYRFYESVGWVLFALPNVPLDDSFANIYLLETQSGLLMGHYWVILVLLGIIQVQILTENIRLHWPNLNYPFKKIIQKTFREEEQYKFAAHIQLTICTVLMAAIFLYWNPILPFCIAINVVYAVVSFGDAIAAIIGKRFGSHKISFNKDKSWEGNLSAVAFCFLLGSLIGGLIYGFIGALAFMIVDLATPKIKITDNVLNPLVLTSFFAIYFLIVY
ncbi:MAG: hypothetical protein ACTSRZ_08225 [Promethearchaeota archaeon]